MCGIAGLIDLTGRRPIPRGILEAMAGAIVHRGPDEDGFVEWPGLGLASRRLSIVGLQNGHQPMADRSQNTWVAFNGELYDYPQLRPQLEARGHTFATHCDTELLLHLAEEYGDDFLQHVRGQFAFALWNQRRQRLTLARDRVGICPLYWTVVRGSHPTPGEWLVFASEIRALFASGLVSAKPDPRGIHQLFTFIGVPGPVTCFEGIHCLLPGHSLSIQLAAEGGRARVEDRTYWQVEFPDEGFEYDGRCETELVDEFEALLYQAVERRLWADVPVVSYLSGGVDSSLIAAMASKVLRAPIPTYTVRVSEPSMDEGVYARTVADHLRSQPQIVPYSPEDLLRTYPELIQAAEAPVIDTSCAASLLLAQRVHQDGYKVALTGEGADEQLAGYVWFASTAAIRLLSRAPRMSLIKLPSRIQQRILGAPSELYSQIREAEKQLGGPNPWFAWNSLICQSQHRLFSSSMRSQLEDYNPFAELQYDPQRMSRWHPLNRGLAVGMRTLLSGMLLCSKGDRVAMHSSVETRYPFLDEDVVSFLARLHPRWKLRGRKHKYLLRKVAERWLPHKRAWRTKVMFRAPLDPFYSPDAPPIYGQLLSPAALRKTNYFDPAAVQHWQSRCLEMPRSIRRSAIEMGLVGVVATQLWHWEFIDPSLGPSLGDDAKRVEKKIPTKAV